MNPQTGWYIRAVKAHPKWEAAEFAFDFFYIHIGPIFKSGCFEPVKVIPMLLSMHLLLWAY